MRFLPWAIAGLLVFALINGIAVWFGSDVAAEGEAGGEPEDRGHGEPREKGGST